MSLKTLRTLTERGVLAELLIMLEAAFKAQWFDSIVQRTDSVQPDGETYNYVGDVAGMAEDKGDPEFSELGVFDYFIKNIAWMCGFRVKKSDWDHGKRALIEQLVQEQTDNTAAHPGILLQTLILNAGASACSDGQYFFDTDHPISGGTQSNIVEFKLSTPSQPSPDAMIDALLKAVVQFWTLKSDKGNECNLGINKFMVTAGPTMYPVLTKALGQTVLKGGESNIVVENREFSLVPQMLPRMTGNKVQVFAQNAGSRPLILQILDESAPEVLGRESEYCKLKNHLLFMVKGSYNVGYGRYQRAVELQFTQA